MSSLLRHKKIYTLFATGLWHGASWTFVVWGMIHGFFAVLEQTKHSPFNQMEKRPIGHVYTMLVVVTAFVLFRAETYSQGLYLIGQMYTGFHFESEIGALLLQQLTPTILVALAVGILFSQPVGKWIHNRLETLSYGPVLLYAASLLALLLCLLNLSATTFDPFIYFRF